MTGVRAPPAHPAARRTREPPYASRGAHKLAPALAAWAQADPPLEVAGRRCLDAGASTGGFTDVLLRAGAAQVVAVDVGYGQLAWRLRTDPRVRVLDRCNVRNLTPDAIGGTVDLVVADLSFISLRLVLPALAACTREAGDLVALVKAAIRGRPGVGGTRWCRAGAGAARQSDSRSRRDGRELGLGVRDLRASPLPGPAGNVEYLLWLRRDAPALQAERGSRQPWREPFRHGGVHDTTASTDTDGVHRHDSIDWRRPTWRATAGAGRARIEAGSPAGPPGRKRDTRGPRRRPHGTLLRP